MTYTVEHAQAVDTQLGELWGAHANARAITRRLIDSLHWKLNERPVYLSRRIRTWPTKDDEAEQLVRAKMVDPATPEHQRRDMLALIGSLGEARDRVRRIDARITPLEAEWEAERWPRFFLVVSSDGHIHSSRSCSTTYPSTQWAWLPELSGRDEELAVQTKGPLLCSVCYPSAPVEWTLGRPSAAKCPGSGQRAEARTASGRYGTCSVCHQSFALNRTTGAIRAHKPQEA